MKVGPAAGSSTTQALNQEYARLREQVTKNPSSGALAAVAGAHPGRPPQAAVNPVTTAAMQGGTPGIGKVVDVRL